MSNAFTVSVAQSPAPVPTRRTVDAFTRTWHALLALSFVGAYVTAESEIFRLVHVSLGYILGGLLVARVVWGCLGPRHARLMALWGKLRGWSDIVEGLRTGQASWRQAQNLYMVTSVVAVLLAIAPVVLSGYVSDQEWTGDWMEDVHEFFGNFMLAAVLAHISGVVVLSFVRGRNLAAHMLTGRVEGKGPDLIKSNHGFWAILLWVAVLSFGLWQWQQSTSPDISRSEVGAWLSSGKAQASDDND
jgi:cytochrome b